MFYTSSPFDIKLQISNGEGIRNVKTTVKPTTSYDSHLETARRNARKGLTEVLGNREDHMGNQDKQVRENSPAH